MSESSDLQRLKEIESGNLPFPDRSYRRMVGLGFARWVSGELELTEKGHEKLGELLCSGIEETAWHLHVFDGDLDLGKFWVNAKNIDDALDKIGRNIGRRDGEGLSVIHIGSSEAIY